MKTDRLLILAGASALLAAGVAGAIIGAGSEAPMQRAMSSSAMSPAQSNLFPFLSGGTPAATGDPAQPAVASAVLRDLFEQHLDNTPHRPLADIAQDIENRRVELGLRPAQAETLRLLERYAEYRAQSAGVASAPPGADPLQALRGRRAALRDLRARLFGPEERMALFELEEALEDDALAREEIARSGNLSPMQRQARLAELDTAMKPAVRQAKEMRASIVRIEEAPVPIAEAGSEEEGVFRFRPGNAMPVEPDQPAQGPEPIQ